MSLVRLVLALIVLGSLATLLILGATGPGDSPAPSATSRTTVYPYTSSAQCAECHADVYEEWIGSYHGQAYLDPLVRAPNMSDNFNKKDCVPCHAPRPVFEHGIGADARVVPRSANRHEGVDCLSCHKITVDGVAGMATVNPAPPDAPCNPVHEPRLASVDHCAPCHDQHKTITGEWATTRQAREGIGCNDCHMPDVMRLTDDGSLLRPGRSHGFPGAHDEEMLRSALTVTHETREGSLVVTLHNTGAAHHVPTDARHRAVDLVITLSDARGGIIATTEERESGQERGTHRLRLRNPYRTEVGKLDTRLAADAKVSLEAPLRGTGAVRAVIELIYKLTPYVADDEGVVLYRDEVRLD